MAGSPTTCPRFSRNSALPRSSTTPGTTECAPFRQIEPSWSKPGIPTRAKGRWWHCTARVSRKEVYLGVTPDTTAGSAPAGDPFEALGDPNRRAIVELLGSGGRSVRELAEALPISRPAVSRHLRLLKDAGLVAEEAQGTRRIYHLHAQGVEVVETYLTQVWGDVVTRFRLMAENTAPQSRSGRS